MTYEFHRARATSAAPSYFKTYRSERSRRGYLDGAVYHNNPVRVADLERRLIWPDTELSPPDILLSIGTGCKSTTRQEAAHFLHRCHREQELLPTISSSAEVGTQHNLLGKIRKQTHLSKVYKRYKNRVENILDTEMTWLKFMSDAARGDEDAKKRYCRINPEMKEAPPKLDDVKMLPDLRRQMQQTVKLVGFQKRIGEVARQLVASSFYVEVPYIPTSPRQDFRISVFSIISPSCNKTKLIGAAEIQCKFPSASQEIRHLGEYLKNCTTRNFQPYFIIGEQSSTSEPIKIIITQPLIQRMIMNASFEVEPIQIPVSSESAITTISLSILDGEEISISGLPRALLAKKVVKGNRPSPAISRYQMLIFYASVALSPSSDKPGGQVKPGRASRHATFAGDESSSRSSESSDTAFPELQQLPREAKLPIRDFLREQISRLKGGEEIPRTMRLLAEATEEVEDKDEDVEKRDSETECGGGPYGTILHTAAVVGNYWLAKLQIKAGMDVSALDGHHWTALMVATTQGHNSCIKLLSEQMDSSKVKAAPQPLLPSNLVTAEPKLSISLGQKSLTAAMVTQNSVLQNWIQARSDHPIPPHSPTFYYEITILTSGPFWCVHTSDMKTSILLMRFFASFLGLGLCRPETPVFGMPGWAASSWGYHGDDGKKFNNPSGAGLRYHDSYKTGDTIGCGINIKTGKLFFTKNGFNLGKDLSIGPNIGL